MALGYACASGIAVDEVARPQRMWIMALVWPLTALFGSLAVVILYLSYGRSRPKQVGRHEDTPMWAAVAKSACHCGAGCALGDIVAEWPAFALPMVALWFGWHSLFAEKMFAIWLLDFLLAFLLGITFQYSRSSRCATCRPTERWRGRSRPTPRRSPPGRPECMAS